MRRFLWVAKFVVIQGLVLFAIAEVGLRVLRPRVENLRILLYMPSISAEFEDLDTLSGLLGSTIVGYNPFTARAGFVTNSRGFRTREYSHEKEAGTVRLVAIGDSFTFSSGGIPYSLGWQHGLETRLQARDPRKIEVLSLGVPGIGPLFAQRLWQVEGARMDADVLLFVFFVGNDFSDHFAAEVQEGPGTIAARYSYAVRLVRNLTRVRSAPDATPREAPNAGNLEFSDTERPVGDRGGYEIPEYLDVFANREPWYSPDRLMQVEASRARLCERAQSDGFEDLFDRFATILRDFHREVEAAGVDFRAVVLPDRFQVNPHERTRVLALLRKQDREFDWDKPQRRLRELFEREGVTYLDLLEPFRRQTEHEQLFDPGNTHWNVRGNEFVGERIADWLAPILAESGE